MTQSVLNSAAPYCEKKFKHMTLNAAERGIEEIDWSLLANPCQVLAFSAYLKRGEIPTNE